MLVLRHGNVCDLFCEWMWLCLCVIKCVFTCVEVIMCVCVQLWVNICISVCERLCEWIWIWSCLNLNMLSRLVITFLPRSKCLLISWLQSPFAVILECRKIKSDTVSTVSPSISHEVMGLDAMILVFWMLSFKPTFSLSTFTFTKRLLSSSSLSAIRVVSSAYLSLLIFLPAILIPACVSSSPAFLMMYSA